MASAATFPPAYVVPVEYAVRYVYDVRMSSENPPGPGSGQDAAPGPGGWRGVELLWELDGQTGPPARRGAALDREQIVRAAIRIADAEGLEAVTMRRGAQQLDTG